MSEEDVKAKGFRSMGRNLAHKRLSLEIYLTGNPDIDQHIRAGFAEETAAREAKPKAEAVRPDRHGQFRLL